jgi:hypothetical protein
MACKGNSSETCGGSSTLNLYVASDLESTQPCGYVPPPAPSSSSSPSPSLCTSTSVVSPTPSCEYKCGSWCSSPLSSFADAGSCKTAAYNCAIQLASCFLNAGYPDSLNCFKYASWCTSVSNYCSQYCPGNSCSPSGCKSKYPPSGSPAPSPTTSTSVYTCALSSSPSITSETTSTSCIPVPSSSCVCKQPSNPNKGYSSSSPVGSIPMPCLTCNNLYSDYNKGNWFKLYTSSDSSSCPSYSKSNISKGCKDSCDSQYSACMGTYAQSCKSNSQSQIAQGADSYNSASTKCQNQLSDCYSANAYANGGNLCNGWNSGWN